MTEQILTGNQIKKIKRGLLDDLQEKRDKLNKKAAFFRKVADEKRSEESRKDLHEHATKLEAKASALNSYMCDIITGGVDGLLMRV